MAGEKEGRGKWQGEKESKATGKDRGKGERRKDAADGKRREKEEEEVEEEGDRWHEKIGWKKVADGRGGEGSKQMTGKT